METVSPRLQPSLFSGSDCSGYIYQNENEAEVYFWGYDTASYLRKILSWIMTLYYIPDVLGYDAASYS
jgi:hypothetical protein